MNRFTTRLKAHYKFRKQHGKATLVLHHFHAATLARRVENGAC
jgi:hypothetical protein